MTRLYASAAALLALAAASGCAEGSDMDQTQDPATMGDGGAVADAGAMGGKDGSESPDDDDDGTVPTMDSGAPDGPGDGSLGIDAGADASVADGGVTVVDAGADVDASIEPPMVVHPDMVLTAATTQDSIVLVDETVPADSCYLGEACVEAGGLRRLLQFSLEARNVGEGDLILGDPNSALGFRVAACSAENEYEYYTRFELKDSTGATVRSRYGFGGCVAGTVPGDAGVDPTYDCAYQGIPAGGVSFSEVGEPCQWVDVTGLAGGNYTLVASINPWRKFAETNYDNNTITVPVTIPTPPPPPDPTDDGVLLPCAESDSGMNRDCGWVMADQALTCTPGERVINTCDCAGQGVCTGDTVMRICEGDGPCLGTNALDNDDDGGDCGSCSRTDFTCPASGVYSVLVAGYSTTTTYTCDPIAITGSSLPDPTTACATSSSGLSRECGWTSEPSNRGRACTPGETVRTNCGCGGGSCTGDTIMRICGGDTVCGASAALASNDNGSSCGNCSATQFTCPASGEFTIMWAPYFSTSPATCVPVVQRDTPPDPLAACTGDEQGKTRECGWAISVQGPAQTCTPGATVAATCGCGGGVCQGDTMIRVCNGSGPCAAAAAIGVGDDDCGLCAKASFTCPQSGVFTMMVGSYKPANAYVCEPAVTEIP